MVLMRGFLYVDLIEADNLPDCDTAFFNFDAKDTSDPFAQVSLGSVVICKTHYINNNLSPQWQESYRIPVCHDVDVIKVQVLDKDHISTGCLGEVELRPEDVIGGDTMEGWYPLSGNDGKVNFKMYFVSKEDIVHTLTVPDCYFDVHEGCKVSLYQDAYCPSLPIFEPVLTASGDPYCPANAWVDLYTSLNAATRFIYMTGWSVYTETLLLRGCECDIEPSEDTLGELLLRKSEEGVRVLILVWNEKTSSDVLPGLMGTHDEDTRAYFEGSSVEVALVPRQKLLTGFGSFIRDQFSQTCYSHHQKTVIVDTPVLDGEELPRITAFVGGLDVTNGRWDTPEHNLFRTLKDAHVRDFYSPCIPTKVESGPRQPWHDIHCKVEGPGAVDLLHNFVERWRQQAAELESRLLLINEEEFDLSSPYPTDDENSSWNTQLFRSITNDSALFDFEKVHSIPKRKGKYVDDSIHRAYIHQIRRSDRFIYIENQYFLGSAYSWEDEINTKAHHLIPKEITERIIEKISNGEELRVYVIVPMFPEGDPASKPVQEILHWQHRTMEMMYKRIAIAIAEYEVDAHPTDYLSFFCLGKRELVPEDVEPAEVEGEIIPSHANGRFMIYVHSKMMIVDDDYVIVGSANINQRSMAGTRDSEIALGAFQPAHTREATDGEPRGSVHQLRLALWSEHLSMVEEVHMDPGTAECMQAMRQAGSDNWSQYIDEEAQDVEGHLITYPVNVAEDGTVTPFEDYPNFPDFEAAAIIGAPNYLPNKLTT